MLRRLPIIMTAIALAGCETYRTEYHRRPAFHQQASLAELPDRVTLRDGTTIVYHSGLKAPRRADSVGSERKMIQMREEHEDGSVTLRAILPEHVISHLLTCLQDGEYELIYSELLSERTREAWEREGNTIDDFIEYFTANRSHMLLALNRIYLGMSSVETIVERQDEGVVECRLRSSSAQGMRFSRVRVIPEGYGLKLLTVR